MDYKDGITYNGQHSNANLGLLKVDVEKYTTPTKKKTLETIPFMNGSYDFSDIFGDIQYEERDLEYILFVDVRNLGISDSLAVERYLEIKKIQIENWLLGSNSKTILKDDSLVGYYYMAECVSVDFEKWFSMGKISANFIAYPFKIADLNEGENLWDSFNFELDILQDTKFDVVNSLEVDIYNGSVISITPEVICSSPMQVTTGEYTYSFGTGTTKDYRFKLHKGNNKISIKGNGNIEFRFKREVL